MTLDEAIAHEREVAKDQKSKYDKCTTRMRYDCGMCFHNPKCNEIAEYHKQLAELLEELKSYRESVFSGDMTQTMLKEEYNEAIDDFSERIKQVTYTSGTESDGYYKIHAICERGIDEIAEQLKAGDGE